MTRRALRVAHRWLGLVLVLPMLVQGITGCVLAVTPVWEALRPSPAVTGGAPQPAGAIAAAALVPGMVPVRYQPGDGGPALVDIAMPGQRGAAFRVMVDPASLTVLGMREPSATYRWVHSLHENLLLPTLPGRSIVGWFGAGLLLLGLSGLVLWWPAGLAPGRWRAAITVGRGVRGARLQRELHGVTGFWACAMLVVMSLSGVSLAFPQTIRAMLAVSDAAPPRGDGAPRGSANTVADLDAVLQRADEAVPGAAVIDVRLPNPPGRPAMVRLRLAGAWDGSPPAVVMVDPAGRRVVSLQDPRTESMAALALGWLRALHFGEALGPVWRALVCLTGVGLPVLAGTGATLWLLRRRNRLRLASQRRAAVQGVAQ